MTDSGPRAWVIVVGLIVLTAAATVLVVRTMPEDTAWKQTRAIHQAEDNTRPGIITILANDRTSRRPGLAAGFTLTRDQSPAFGVDPGSGFTWSVELEVPPTFANRARFGATIANGTVRVQGGGEHLAEGSAGGKATEVWSPWVDITSLGGRVAYEFAANSGGATFRPKWQPGDAIVPLAFEIDATSWWYTDVISEGLSLVQTLNCVACHEASDARLREIVSAGGGPILTRAGARFRPAWLREWIVDPSNVVPHSAMPRVFSDVDEDRTAVEDIVHFLVSLGGPIVNDGHAPGRHEMEAGRALYRDVGCVACHGPRESIGMSIARTYRAIPNQRRKTIHPVLTRFLRDPVGWHPSGRMPGMDLSDREASQLASYLLEDESDDDLAPEDFNLDDARVGRGRAAFVSYGCIACHEVAGLDVSERMRADASLEDLAGRGTDGCLSDDDGAGGVRFDLDAGERAAIAAWLESASDGGANAPIDLLGAALRRFNCMACHAVNGAGGAEPALWRFFRAAEQAKLPVDEALPPALNGIGGTLTKEWMRDVLERGARARPYLLARMPQFGSPNVRSLPELFASASGTEHVAAAAGDSDPEHIGIGRLLVGVGGLNCISCHAVAGRPSTGIAGIDLVNAQHRLTTAHFQRWVLEPQAIRPGTRMTDFFNGSESVSVGFLNGDALAQVQAMRDYLSQGTDLVPPDGLTPANSFTLTVEDRPIVLRIQLRETGHRAIAAGTAGGFNLAFDIDQPHLASVWRGALVDETTEWIGADRSVSYHVRTPDWTPPRPMNVLVDDQPHPTKFVGYVLDDGGWPTMHYVIEASHSFPVAERVESMGGGEEGFRRILRFENPSDAEVMVVFDRWEGRVTDPDQVGGGKAVALVIQPGESQAVVLEYSW